MYISKIRIQNFRCFKDATIKFNQGLNVIIGENNSGKTTILKAFQLLSDRFNSGKPTVDDFYKNILSFNEPPKITISVTIKESADESLVDKAVVASWLTKLSSPWEATLTYVYFLPESDFNNYVTDIRKCTERGSGNYYGVLEKFLPKYVSRIYGGNPDARNRAESEWLEKFECELLDALIDVESKMLTGRNPLLKQVLNHFLDFDLKDKRNRSTDQEKEEEIEQRQAQSS